MKPSASACVSCVRGLRVCVCCWPSSPQSAFAFFCVCVCVCFPLNLMVSPLLSRVCFCQSPVADDMLGSPQDDGAVPVAR